MSCEWSKTDATCHDRWVQVVRNHKKKEEKAKTFGQHSIVECLAQPFRNHWNLAYSPQLPLPFYYWRGRGGGETLRGAFEQKKLNILGIIWYLVCGLIMFLIVLKVSPIVTNLQTVLGHPLRVIISSLGCYTCYSCPLPTNINLYSLTQISSPNRPSSRACFVIQSPKRDGM